MFVFTPILVMIIVTVTCVSLFILRFWFGRMEITPEKLSLINAGRGLGHIFYATLSLFLLDIIYRLINTELLSFGHPKYYLTAVILTSIYCAYLMIGTVFSAPTWKTIVTFIAMCSASVFVLISSKTDEAIGVLEVGLYPFITGVAVEVILNIVDISMKQKKAPAEGKLSLSKPLWNLSDKLHPIYSIKGMVGMYLMFCAELILLFEGTTMLYWLR